MDPKTIERIEAARAEVRRAIESDNLALIHPFDLYRLLENPTTMDAVIVHIDGRQYVVVDGVAYRCTSDVKNHTKLSEIMVRKSDEVG